MSYRQYRRIVEEQLSQWDFLNWNIIPGDVALELAADAYSVLEAFDHGIPTHEAAGAIQALLSERLCA